MNLISRCLEITFFKSTITRAELDHGNLRHITSGDQLGVISHPFHGLTSTSLTTHTGAPVYAVNEVGVVRGGSLGEDIDP